jgi:hypothetical protein
MFNVEPGQLSFLLTSSNVMLAMSPALKKLHIHTNKTMPLRKGTHCWSSGPTLESRLGTVKVLAKGSRSMSKLETKS